MTIASGLTFILFVMPLIIRQIWTHTINWNSQIIILCAKISSDINSLCNTLAILIREDDIRKSFIREFACIGRIMKIRIHPSVVSHSQNQVVQREK